MRIFLDRLYLFAGVAAGGFMVLIFILMMALSAGRPVGVNVPAGDDIVAWCMAAMSFLGLAHTFRSGEMIRVGLLLERLGGRNRRVLELASLATALAFVAYFARFGVGMTYDSWRFHDMAQGVLAIPLWIPQLGFASGLVIFAISLADDFLAVARGRLPSYDLSRPKTPEEIVQHIAEGESI